MIRGQMPPLDVERLIGGRRSQRVPTVLSV
jgi:hypothetical protein